MEIRDRRYRGKVSPVAELYPPQSQWTEEDYLALPETNRCVELSEGELIIPPHPTYSHQGALLKFYTRLRGFVEEHGLGEVLVAPLPVRLWPGKIREPDIFFIAEEHLERIGEKVCGAPDLVMEVVSSSTRIADCSEKFFEYTRAGVQEYWLVDPEAKTVEVYVLREGAYEPLGKYNVGQVACSRLFPDFRISVDGLFSGR